jgi:hypothetical protein
MGDVIDLTAKHAAQEIRRELLADTLQRLEAAADVLLEDLVNLAMRGPWRDWSAAQAVGTLSHVGCGALAECGDPTIVELNAALRRMREALAAVREMQSHADDA